MLDERTVVAGTLDGYGLCIDTAERTTTLVGMPLEGAAVIGLMPLSTKRLAAVTKGTRNALVVWTIGEQNSEKLLFETKRRIFAAGLAENRKRVLLSTIEAVEVRDVESGRAITSFRPAARSNEDPNPVVGIVVDGKSNSIVLLTAEGEMEWWTSDYKLRHVQQHPKISEISAAPCKNGNYLIARLSAPFGEQSALVLYTFASYEPLLEIRSQKSTILAAEMSSTCERIAWIESDGQVIDQNVSKLMESIRTTREVNAE
jgi:hypothetical protein